jgi:hypothetical protein
MLRPLGRISQISGISSWGLKKKENMHITSEGATSQIWLFSRDIAHHWSFFLQDPPGGLGLSAGFYIWNKEYLKSHCDEATGKYPWESQKEACIFSSSYLKKSRDK